MGLGLGLGLGLLLPLLLLLLLLLLLRHLRCLLKQRTWMYMQVWVQVWVAPGLQGLRQKRMPKTERAAALPPGSMEAKEKWQPCLRRPWRGPRRQWSECLLECFGYRRRRHRRQQQ